VLEEAGKQKGAWDADPDARKGKDKGFVENQAKNAVALRASMFSPGI
jgi:hypothetical protein